MIVVVLGIAAIAFGSTLPDGIEAWMGRIVGVTLVVLGAWILIDLGRSGRDFRLRSRWILVLGGAFAGLRRVRDATARRRIVVDHDHDHPHIEADQADHGDPQAHDHAHGRVGAATPEVSFATAGGGRWWKQTTAVGHRHAHRHRHELGLATAQAGGPGNGTAAGIGLLHGIGVESPTQIAIFVASTSVVGTGAGIALLGAWVAGLVLANSALAVLAALGLLEAERNFGIYAGVAVFVAVASLAMGLFILAGAGWRPSVAITAAGAPSRSGSSRRGSRR